MLYTILVCISDTPAIHIYCILFPLCQDPEYLLHKALIQPSMCHLFALLDTPFYFLHELLYLSLHHVTISRYYTSLVKTYNIIIRKKVNGHISDLLLSWKFVGLRDKYLIPLKQFSQYVFVYYCCNMKLNFAFTVYYSFNNAFVHL